MSLTPPSPAELREFRRKTGLSQARLAELLGASTRAVEEWEGGRRLPPPMLRLALGAINQNVEPWSFIVPAEGRIMRKG